MKEKNNISEDITLLPWYNTSKETSISFSHLLSINPVINVFIFSKSVTWQRTTQAPQCNLRSSPQQNAIITKGDQERAVTHLGIGYCQIKGNKVLITFS